MADNTTLNTGAGGDVIATDDVGGAKYQRNKRSLGRDGTAVDAALLARLVSAAAANQDSTIVKSTAGVLFSVAVTNANAAPRYLKLYNKATGATSADTPVMTLYVPALGGLVYPLDPGVDFTAGIGARMTTGVADNDAVAVAANEVIAHFSYV